MSNICKNCEYWHMSGSVDFGLQGECSKIKITGCNWQGADENCPVNGIFQENDDHLSEIYFGPEFGCIHFKKIKKLE